MRKTILLASCAATLLARSANAQLTLIPSLQAFGTPGGTIVWTDLGARIPNPSTFDVTGIPGLTVLASSPQLCPCRSPYDFYTSTQGPFGEFLPGDALLEVFGFAEPLSLSFSTPVYSFGTRIGLQIYGDWLADISAFGANDEPLGTFLVPFFEDEIKPLDSAPFVGVSYSGGISRIDLSIDYTDGRQSVYDWDINQGLVSRVIATPEPSSFSLAGLALLGSIAIVRRRTHMV
jgi:hypothetical protein